MATKISAHGFFSPQTDDSGNRYVWSEPTASTRFQFIGREAPELVLSLRSAAVAGGPDAPIHVIVNGQEAFQVRPDPHNAAFQTFRLQLPRQTHNEMHIALQAEPFRPRNGDRRILGAMVQSISVSQRVAWSIITRHAWLYMTLPIFAALATACIVLSRRTPLSRPFSAQWVINLRYSAVASCFAGTASMVAAVSLLLRIGRIDQYRYLFWLAGSAYLGGLFAAVAMHVPMRSPTRSMWLTCQQSAFLQRRSAFFLRVGNALLFGLATMIAVYYLRSPGTGDVPDKIRWMDNIASHGLIRGFQISKDDYPPGTYIILAIMTKIAPHLHMGFFMGYKLSLLIFLLLSSLVLFLWTRNALFAVIMQCALMIDSMVMGYNDVYFIPTLVLALWALRARKPVWFSALFTITCLMKWQPLILVPVLLLYALATMTAGAWRGKDVRQLALAVTMPAIGLLAATFAVFGREFFSEFHRATSENFLSANALNFHWIVTQFLAWWRPQQFTFGTGMHRRFIRIPSATTLMAIKLLFGVIYLSILMRFTKRSKTFITMLHYAYVGYLAYFLFNTSVHENHLVPAVVLAGLLWAFDQRYAPLFVLTAIITNLNMLLFYDLNGVARLPVLARGVDVALVLSILNVALFGLLSAYGPRLFMCLPHAAQQNGPCRDRGGKEGKE
ncbi:MAG: hypothetical protein ACR2M3_16530 [Thermomicrobiales bacterium]